MPVRRDDCPIGTFDENGEQSLLGRITLDDGEIKAGGKVGWMRPATFSGVMTLCAIAGWSPAGCVSWAGAPWGEADQKTKKNVINKTHCVMMPPDWFGLATRYFSLLHS